MVLNLILMRSKIANLYGIFIRVSKSVMFFLLPLGIVKLLARGMEWKSRRTNNKEPVLTVYGVGTLSKSFTMDITKAKKLLGYNPKVTIDEAIHEFVNWYKANENV